MARSASIVEMLAVNKLKAALWASITGRGLLGWLIMLFKPAAAGLSMAGDVDLLSNYFGAIGRFLDTGWGTLTSVVLGAIIIGYAMVSADLKKSQSANIAKPTGTSARYYSIHTGIGRDYDLREPSLYGGIIHTIRVKITNGTSILIGAKLSVINLNPASAGHRNFSLPQSINLSPSESTYVRIASHTEGIKADQNLIQLQTSYPGGFAIPTGFGTLIGEHKLQLRLSRNEERLAEHYCRLYIDDHDVMRLESLDKCEATNGL